MRRHSDTLRAANAATKEGVNGGENARASVLRSEGVCSSVKKPRTRRRKRGSRGENRISVSEFCCLPVLLLCLPVCHTVPTTLTVAVPGMTFHVPSAFCVYVAAGTTICPATVANAPVALS